MDPVVITMRLSKGNAVTQYSGIKPKHLCNYNGVGVMSGDNGVFTLQGEDDNGVAISSKVVSPSVAPGGLQQSRLRFLHVSGEYLSNLQAVCLADETSSFTATLAANEKDGVQEDIMVPGQRNVQGGFWSVAITNLLGGYFALDTVSASSVILPRRPRLR